MVNSFIGVGDKVEKIGSYTAMGVVASVYPGADELPRYVVRHKAEGGGTFDHIYMAKNLRLVARSGSFEPENESQETADTATASDDIFIDALRGAVNDATHLGDSYEGQRQGRQYRTFAQYFGEAADRLEKAARLIKQLEQDVDHWREQKNFESRHHAAQALDDEQLADRRFDRFFASLDRYMMTHNKDQWDTSFKNEGPMFWKVRAALGKAVDDAHAEDNKRIQDLTRQLAVAHECVAAYQTELAKTSKPVDLPPLIATLEGEIKRLNSLLDSEKVETRRHFDHLQSALDDHMGWRQDNTRLRIAMMDIKKVFGSYMAFDPDAVELKERVFDIVKSASAGEKPYDENDAWSFIRTDRKGNAFSSVHQEYRDLGERINELACHHPAFTSAYKIVAVCVDHLLAEARVNDLILEKAAAGGTK